MAKKRARSVGDYVKLYGVSWDLLGSSLWGRRLAAVLDDLRQFGLSNHRSSTDLGSQQFALAQPSVDRMGAEAPAAPRKFLN
jgi:hypothetical protein